MSISENVVLCVSDRSRGATGWTQVRRHRSDGSEQDAAARTIRAAYDAGLRLFGENRVQEFAGKFDSLRNLPGAEWHMNRPPADNQSREDRGAVSRGFGRFLKLAEKLTRRHAALAEAGCAHRN